MPKSLLNKVFVHIKLYTVTTTRFKLNHLFKNGVAKTANYAMLNAINFCKASSDYLRFLEKQKHQN